ncbi:MAG: ABC transporter permease [Deltaproteobacteria bacterium]|nr:ABC transporter permease [Deltaproteobacteria bacterium]
MEKKRKEKFLQIKRFLSNGKVLFGGIVLLLLAFTSISAPYIAPHDPNEQELTATKKPPFWIEGGDTNHILGTDSLGRDIFSRLLYGSRVAMFVAVVGTFFAGLIGVTLALLAGYYRGAVDNLISRFVDVWISFPPILLSIVLMAVLGTGITKVALAIILVDWTRFCRVIRGEVFNIREKDFILAARAIALGNLRIIVKEVFPNIVPLLIVLVTLEMGIAIIVEAILSFVGLSVEASIPAWGQMIALGRLYIHQAWWIMVFPMICIIISVLGLNLLGDGLREVLDPRLKVMGMK